MGLIMTFSFTCGHCVNFKCIYVSYSGVCVCVSPVLMVLRGSQLELQAVVNFSTWVLEPSFHSFQEHYALVLRSHLSRAWIIWFCSLSNSLILFSPPPCHYRLLSSQRAPLLSNLYSRFFSLASAPETRKCDCLSRFFHLTQWLQFFWFSHRWQIFTFLVVYVHIFITCLLMDIQMVL
jgi:hypothetical protein